MNKPIEIVLNAATIEYVTATWKDLQVVNGEFTIGERYSFPWKKLFAKEKKTAVNAATGLITVTPATPTLGLEYRFTLVQYVADARREVAISYTADAADVAAGVNSVVTKLKTLITAYVSGGSLDVTLGASASTVQIYSTLTNPLINIGGLLNATATPVQAGTAGRNMGAIMLSEGVVDSFDGTLPTAGALYTSYELTLMLPKGSGGFNEQTSDQEHTLMLYVDENGAPSGHFIVDLDKLLNGEDATNNTDADASDLIAL